MERFNSIFALAVEGGASDVHIKIGAPVIFRINRRLISIECPHPTAEWMENIIEHIYRLFATQLAKGAVPNLDDVGRIRVDDLELADPVQAEVRRRWARVTTENLPELGDLEGFRRDFLKIFGFGIEGVDYDAEQDPTLGRAV